MPENRLLWIVTVDVFLMFGLCVLILVTRVAGRPVLPPLLYKLLSVVGLCGWVLYFFASGSFTWPSGMIGVILGVAMMFTPFVLPIAAGFVGWLGTKSRWRWCFLGIGLVTGPGLLLTVLLHTHH